jgi:hypothetical protein
MPLPGAQNFTDAHVRYFQYHNDVAGTKYFSPV